MSTKHAGLWLVLASVTFWVSWMLMPGVGVTDTATIFALVAEHRTSVHASVVLQLLSAAAYVPGVLGLLTVESPRASAALRAGSALVLIGAMGSAADAIFHLVAYEMTAPDVPTAAMATVMRRLQGPDLALLLPFVAAFFAGHALLVGALRKRGPMARLGAWVLLATLAVLLVGIPGVRSGLVPGRIVGLAVLGALSGSLAIVGISTAVDRERA